MHVVDLLGVEGRCVLLAATAMGWWSTDAWSLPGLAEVLCLGGLTMLLFLGHPPPGFKNPGLLGHHDPWILGILE